MSARFPPAPPATKVARCHFVSNSLVGVAILLVVVVLAFGLVNMLRGGSPSRSQTLMRWRVGLQFVAIVAIVLALYLRRH